MQLLMHECGMLVYVANFFPLQRTHLHVPNYDWSKLHHGTIFELYRILISCVKHVAIPVNLWILAHIWWYCGLEGFFCFCFFQGAGPTKQEKNAKHACVISRLRSPHPFMWHVGGKLCYCKVWIKIWLWYFSYVPWVANTAIEWWLPMQTCGICIWSLNLILCAHIYRTHALLGACAYISTGRECALISKLHQIMSSTDGRGEGLCAYKQ